MSDLVETKSPKSGRTFKQARLPFKVLDGVSPFLNNVPKKRKLSDEEPGQEAKTVKKDHNPDVELVKTVNSGVAADRETHLTTACEGTENLKPKECNSNENSILTVLVPSSPNHKELVNKTLASPVGPAGLSKVPVPPVNCTKPEKESKTENNDAEVELPKDLSEEEKMDTSFELLDTTVATADSVSCEEESELNDVSLKISSGSLDAEEEEEEELKQAQTSELDSSICLSAAGVSATAGSGNDCSVPSVKKDRKPRKTSGPRKSADKEKHKEEKARMRAEKERKLQEARDEKRREKERREVERNMAKQKRKLELEEKLKEKEFRKAESLAKKNAELDEKHKAQEEKKAKKQEIMQAKLDEKKRKEEERQRKKDKQKEDEEKQKKLDEKKRAEKEVSAKSKAAFASFFIKGSSAQLPTAPAEDSRGLFKPFEVTKNMKLASIIPEDIINRFDKEKLDGSFHKQDTCCLYLEELKSRTRVPYKRKKAEVKEEDTDDIIILDDTKCERSVHHGKLYQFVENVRPPYFGTWTKSSKVVKGRRPFSLDKDHFDYDVDSEEEWDEGGPGESLSGTEEEKESEDDYEVDNEFFVPHGYLSADEENEEDVGVDSEEHQARLKMREHMFQEERKQKFSALKPRVIGCIWTSADGLSIPQHHAELAKVLSPYRAVLFCALPIPTALPQVGQSPAGDSSEDHRGDASSTRQQKEIPEEAMPHLIRLVHANQLNRPLIMKEFMHYWTEHRQKADNSSNEDFQKSEEKDKVSTTPVNASPEKPGEEKPLESPPGSFVYNTGFSKRLLEETLKKISFYGRGPDPNYTKYAWWVREDVRVKYGCLDLPVPNKWFYVSRSNSQLPDTRGRKKKLVLENDVPDKIPTTDVEVPTKVSSVEGPSNTILKFTCKMSPSERFEANLKVAGNQNEGKTPTVASSNLNTLFNYALKTSRDNNSSKLKSDSVTLKETLLDESTPNSVCPNKNDKTPKRTGGISSMLNFAKRISPVTLGPVSITPSSNDQESNDPTKLTSHEPAKTVEVIQIDDDSNK